MEPSLDIAAVERPPSLARRVAGTFVKPLTSPHVPHGKHAATIVFMALVGIATTTLAIVVRHATLSLSFSWETLLVAALVGVAAGWYINDPVTGRGVMASDAACVIAALSLSPMHATLVLLFGAIVHGVAHSSVWTGAALGFCVELSLTGISFGVVLLAHDWIIGQLGYLLGTTVSVALLMLMWSVVAWLNYAVEWLVGCHRVNNEGARQSMAAYWPEFKELVWTSTGQFPMATLGVLAFALHPTLVLLTFIPMVSEWRHVRQIKATWEAEERAGIDALTGLLNRGKIFEQLEEEIVAARRFNHPLAVILGDLDNFKRVNDTYGHLVGDEVLRQVSAAFQDVVDTRVFPVARYGGEEFIVAIPVASQDEVLRIAERIRTGVADRLSEWHTTISLGVSYVVPHDRVESLVDRADKGLYSAKYAGKDRVHEWPGDGLDTPGATKPGQPLANGDEAAA